MKRVPRKNLEESILLAEPPSAPQNLTVNFVDQSTVILSWNAPHMQGGRSDTTYRVVCDACSMGVKYIPNTVSFLLRCPTYAPIKNNITR